MLDMNETLPVPARRGPKPRPETRENLLLAGMDMFHERGYAAAGIKDIVEMANVPKGSFYNHFESKESFGKEVIDCYFNMSLSGLQKLLSDESLTPIARLRLYFEKRIQLLQTMDYKRGCLMGNLSLEIADHSTMIRESLANNFRTWCRLIEACIAEAKQKGEIRNRLPASLLAQFLINSWEGALLRMRTEQSEQPLKDFVDVVFTSLLV